jgi:hypothetical protein
MAQPSEAAAAERDEPRPADDAPRRWQPRWPEYLAAAAILVLVAFSLAVTRITGAAVPQNDDWSYVKGAFLLHDTGGVRLQGWGQMFLLGQTYTAQPLLWVFGNKTFALDLYGAGMAIVWFWCAYLLGKRCLGPGRGLLLVLALALWPGMGLLVSSFMTDLPAAATSLLAMVLGLRAIDRQSRLWLGLSILAGIWSFTIREQFVMGLGAVLVAALVSRTPSRRFRIEATVGIGLAAVVCAALEHFRHQLPHADVAPFGFSTLDLSHVPDSLTKVPFTIGLEFAPVLVWVLLTLRGRDWLAPGRLVGWAFGLLILAVQMDWVSGTPRAVLSNYLTPQGGFGVAVVGRVPTIFPPELWKATQLIAAGCGVLLLGELVAWLARVPRLWSAARAGNSAATMVAAYTAVLAVITVGLSFAGQFQVDRYLLPVLPGIGILLLSQVRAERLARPSVRSVTLVPVLAAALFLAALSARVTISTDQRDHAVFAAANRLVAQHVPAATINAGLDWNGLHAATAVDRKHIQKHMYVGQHWTYMFSKSTDCYVVAVSPLRRRWLTLISRQESGYRIWTYYNTRCVPTS